MQVLGWSFSHLPGDAVDTRFNIFIMEHGYRYIHGLETSFWNVRIFYPARLVTAYSDAHLGNLPVYSLLREFGLSPIRSLQFWWLGCYVLNYVSVLMMLKRLGSSWLGASCGAYLFAFGISTLTPTTQHVQLAPRFLAPWILLVGYKWMLNPRRYMPYIIIILVTIQTYQTIYIGYFTCLIFVIQLIVTLGVLRGEMLWTEHRRQAKFTCGAVILALLLLAPLFWPYIQAAPDRGYFSSGFLINFLPTPGSWITPAGVSLHALWMKNWNDLALETAHELELFPGWVMVTVFMVTAMRYRDYPLVVKSSIMTTIVTLLFTLRLGPISLYNPLFEVPAIKGIQAVSRIALVMLVPLGIILAFWISHHQRSWQTVVLVLPMFIADHMINIRTGDDRWTFFRCSVLDLEERQSRMKRMILEHPQPRLVYVYPISSTEDWESRRLRLDAMLACQELGLPCVNGWSGSTPRTYDQFTEPDQVMNWLTVLNRVSAEEIQGLVLIGQPGSAHK